MSDLTDWLGSRRPLPPDDLRRRLVASLPDAGRDGDPADWLLGAARERLDAARDRPGRVRETAFELLVADALVTYACEAALESDRTEEVLERIVEVGRTR